MTDNRSYGEIDNCAKMLHQVWLTGGRGFDIPHYVWLEAWQELSPAERQGWVALAKAVPGVIHHESATSGGFPTSPQADRIRDDLRKSYPSDLWEETHSFIGSMTRPYGDMVVIFQAKGKLPGAKVDMRPIRAYLIHPNGHISIPNTRSVMAPASLRRSRSTVDGCPAMGPGMINLNRRHRVGWSGVPTSRYRISYITRIVAMKVVSAGLKSLRRRNGSCQKTRCGYSSRPTII